MIRKIAISVLLLSAAPIAIAQTTQLNINSGNLTTSPVFNDVTNFNFAFDIAVPLQSGVFNNPDISSIVYDVGGQLPTATPSGFDAFLLEREITGAEYYAQGSALQFEIRAGAELSDGVQIDELVGNDIVFTLNAREVNNGRFHPPILELRADGTGTIRNSNNVVSESPLQTVDFGQEYITDFVFDPASYTILTASGTPPPGTNAPPPVVTGFGAAGSVGLASSLMLLLLAIRRRWARTQ
ncbi:MAG: hypothetical protein AAAFM81_07060 [Pseudomonadota bacterium]